jgi:hypothetical protein
VVNPAGIIQNCPLPETAAHRTAQRTAQRTAGAKGSPDVAFCHQQFLSNRWYDRTYAKVLSESVDLMFVEPDFEWEFQDSKVEVL